MAEEKKPEEKKPPELPKKAAGKQLPPSIADVRGTPQEQVVRNWNAQAKSGLIHQCKEDGCYFPLNPVRDANSQPVAFRSKTRNKRGLEIVESHFLMTCSYHPDHGESITIPSDTVVIRDGLRATSMVGFKVKAVTKEDDID